MIGKMSAILLAGSALALLANGAAHANVKISGEPTHNMSCSGGVCSPTGRNAVLNATDLANMLAAGDATVKSASEAPDIEIDAPLSWTSTHKLTLDAFHSIAFNKPVIVTGTGAVTISTDNGGNGGDFRFFGKGHMEFWDAKSLLTINGQWYVLVDSVKELAKLVRQGNNGFYALRKSTNAKGHAKSPIGSFSGIFEGLGNTISNISIIGNQEAYVGIFSVLGLYGPSVIRDVRIKNATITANDPLVVGVLVGSNAGTIANCDISGRIIISGSGAHAGGLMGIGTNIIRSSAAVDISGSAVSAGGLVGIKNSSARTDPGIIDESFATGTIAGGGGATVGGLIGENNGAAISNSYSKVAVTAGAGGSAGGLAGLNADGDGGSPTLSSLYSTGSVSGAGATVGGAIGADAADAENSNLYWDLDTSGVSDPAQGAGNIKNDPGITGLTDTQLKSGLPAGFDPKIWRQNPKINNGYPYLINNPPPK